MSFLKMTSAGNGPASELYALGNGKPGEKPVCGAPKPGKIEALTEPG